MSTIKVPKKLDKNGIWNNIIKTLYIWYLTPFDKKKLSKRKKNGVYLRWFVAYIYFDKISVIFRRIVSISTAYFPFSLLFQDRLFHAKNLKARSLMINMEDLAKTIGISIYIDSGHFERTYSVLVGKFTRGGINKEEALEKMQKLFQEKIGNVFVQNQDTGFRVLVDSHLVTD